MTESDQLRVSATHLSELALEGRRHLIEEHSASFRWLTASFLAMNGTGLFGLRDVKLSDPAFALAAGVAFFLGIVCALLIAFLGQKSNQKMLDPMSRMSLYWRGVAVSGLIDSEVQLDIDKRIAAAMKLAKRPARAGFASLAFFSTGLAAIALGWIPVSG